MPVRWAYWVKDANLMTVADSPRTKRLRLAWPNLPDDPEQQWMSQDHPQGGALVIWPRLDGLPVAIERFGKPRDTHDGMVYYPSLESAIPEELIRPERHRIQGTWVSMYNGHPLHVALATATPRELIMRASGGITYGQYQNEFGVLGHDLYEPFCKEGLSIQDPRLGRLLFLAIQQSYCITEEMFEDLRWIGEADINPIMLAVMGIDPKALAAALAGSASADPATPTSP